MPIPDNVSKGDAFCISLDITADTDSNPRVGKVLKYDFFFLAREIVCSFNTVYSIFKAWLVSLGAVQVGLVLWKGIFCTIGTNVAHFYLTTPLNQSILPLCKQISNAPLSR